MSRILTLLTTALLVAGGARGADADAAAEETAPLTEREWLQSMVWHHGFSLESISAATGRQPDDVAAALREFHILADTKPARPADAPFLTLPYPGGLHPRLGFLDGAVNPLRGTKLSIFPPWADGGYIVVDVPEAIWFQRGLLFLAHKHIPTVWGEDPLPDVDWRRGKDGTWHSRRTLPDGTSIHVDALPAEDHVGLYLELRNGQDSALTDLRVQVCVLLGRAKGFEAQSSANKVLDPPFAAAGSDDGRRWVITAWQPVDRAWENPPCPCIHSDPVLPDCPPGGTTSACGWISFYEGDDVRAELRRLRERWNATENPPKPAPAAPHPPR